MHRPAAFLVGQILRHCPGIVSGTERPVLSSGSVLLLGKSNQAPTASTPVTSPVTD